VVSAGSSSQHKQSYKDSVYKVTVTNVTRGQRFTPIIAATHKKDIQFFKLGQPAIEPLSIMAESGNTAPLNEVLTGSNLVSSTIGTEGLLNPGQSTTFTIEGSKGFNRFSIAAMLIPTNDSFFALNKVRLPHYGQRTYYALGYDAGSEPNDELCANIPGPDCGGVGGSPDVGGEGFVHISGGIHGEGELSSAAYDWRNPVAKVVIRRVK